MFPCTFQIMHIFVPAMMHMPLHICICMTPLHICIMHHADHDACHQEPCFPAPSTLCISLRPPWCTRHYTFAFAWRHYTFALCIMHTVMHVPLHIRKTYTFALCTSAITPANVHAVRSRLRLLVGLAGVICRMPGQALSFCLFVEYSSWGWLSNP